jgi:hypothetical protein
MEPKTDTLDNRIIAQKVAYLVDKRGITGGYNNFFWSSEQAESIEEQEQVLNDFKSELKMAGLYDYLCDVNKMELITTILYYSNKMEDLNTKNEILILDVKSAKEKFKDDEIKEAISKLKQINWVYPS